MKRKIVKDTNISIRSVNSNFLAENYNADKSKKIYSHYLGEMAFETPVFIQKKVEEISKQKTYGYGFLKQSFYDAVINWFKKIKGVDNIKKEWINLNYGTIQGIMSLLQIKFEKNSKILITTPVYSPFKEIIEHSNMNMVASELVVSDNKYVHNFEDLEKKLKSGVSAFILCSPHNPGGRIWTKEELLKILKLTEKYSVLLIVDEVNSDIVINGSEFLSILKYINEKDNVVVFSSANKSFNLGGLKTSYSISPNAKLLSDIRRGYKKTRITSPNTFGSEAIEAAYKNGEEWLNELNDVVTDNYLVAKEMINSSQVLSIMKNEGGFFAWINFAKILKWRETFEKELLKENIIIEYGDHFVNGPRDFFRFTLANSKENVVHSISKIIEVAKKIHEKNKGKK